MINKLCIVFIFLSLQVDASQRLNGKRTIQFAQDVVSQRPQAIYKWKKCYSHFPYDDTCPYRFCYVLTKQVYRP